LNANRLEIKQRAQRGMTCLNLTYIFVMAAKKPHFFGEKKGFKIFSKIRNSDFCQKCDIFFRFFHRSLAKSRRTAKIPTVLSSLHNMLTILITFIKINFLTSFRIFGKGVYRLFFRKKSKIKNF